MGSFFKISMYSFAALLLITENVRGDCTWDTKMLGCPCGIPLGSGKYMYNDQNMYGCFKCPKNKFFDEHKTKRCQPCTGHYTSCENNVSPNACKHRSCKDDAASTNSAMTTNESKTFGATSKTSVSRFSQVMANKTVTSASDNTTVEPYHGKTYGTEKMTGSAFVTKALDYNTINAGNISRDVAAPTPISVTNEVTTLFDTRNISDKTALIVVLVVLIVIVSLLGISGLTWTYRRARKRKLARLVVVDRSNADVVTEAKTDDISYGSLLQEETKENSRNMNRAPENLMH